MSQTKHELEMVAENSAKEIDPMGSMMGQLSGLVWGGNAPFSTHLKKGDAEQMYASELSSPEGRMRLIQKFGQQRAALIEKELVKAGRIKGQTMQG